MGTQVESCSCCEIEPGNDVLATRLVTYGVDGCTLATQLRFTLCANCVKKFDEMMRLSKFSLMLMRNIRDKQ